MYKFNFQFSLKAAYFMAEKIRDIHKACLINEAGRFQRNSIFPEKNWKLQLEDVISF